MKTITTIVLGLLLIPSVSFAAPLTNDQANSLIAVVQSSPTTPASAFVPLITNFSNITLTQATTLIEVVQAAPGVPATAFVNMLLAFTVDPVVPEPVIGAVAQAPVNNPQTQVVPVVESPVMKEIQIIANGDKSLQDIVVHYKEDGKYKNGVPVTVTVPDGIVFGNDNERKTGAITLTTHSGRGINSQMSGIVLSYIPGSTGTKTIHVEAGGITKDLQITVK